MRYLLSALTVVLMLLPTSAELKVREFSVSVLAGSEDSYRALQARIGYFGIRVGEIDVQTAQTANFITSNTTMHRTGQCKYKPGKGRPPWCVLGPDPLPGPGPAPAPGPISPTALQDTTQTTIELMGYFPLPRKNGLCYLGKEEELNVTCRLRGVITAGMVEHTEDFIGSLGIEYVTRFGLVAGAGISNDGGALLTLGYGLNWAQ